jgi:hypothetical protein
VLVKRVLFLLNAALAIAILHLISQVHLPSFVKMLLKYLKDSNFKTTIPSKNYDRPKTTGEFGKHSEKI